MDNVSWNTTFRPPVLAPASQGMIAWCTAFAMVSVFITVGNFTTIILFSLKKKLRRKSFFLVMNMAFADLMLGALCLPLFVYWLGGESELWTSRWNSSLDIFLRIADTFFAQASIISAAFISGERLHATCWPLQHRTLTRRTYYVLILLVWLSSTVVSAAVLGPFNASIEVSIYIWVSYAFAMSFIICGCYIGVWVKFKRGGILFRHQNRVSREKSSTKTLSLITFIALLCWLPLIIVNSISLYVPVNRDVLLFANLLNFCNSFANPILYSLRIPEFRKALIPWLYEGRIRKSSISRLVNTTTAVPIQMALRKEISEMKKKLGDEDGV